LHKLFNIFACFVYCYKVNKVRKILRYSSFFFFWLAGIALVAHLIIPHDHHNTEYVPGQNKECPVENQNHHQKHGFPIHCHAFNDLAAEKVVKYNSGEKNQNFFTDFICESDLYITKVSAGINIYCNYTEPFPSFILTDFFRLRAPPELA